MSLESDKERFYAMVDKSLHERGCWIWLGYRRKEYAHGQFKYQGVARDAHRVAFFWRYGYFPPVVRHTCDTAGCVNDDHLIDGDHWSNVQDRVERGRSATGERNGRAKLTEDNVRAIKSSDLPTTELAKEFGVNRTLIGKIRAGKIWKSVS